MVFRRWQIGVDIQNGRFCALGIQHRRRGWQLRHWWQHSLPCDLLSQGAIQSPSALIRVLQQWRKLLPRDLSIRVGFPPQAVLQRQVPAPPLNLREPALGRYVTAVAKRAFPVLPENLTLDYRMLNRKEGQISLTATHKTVLAQWLECFGHAGLIPDVVEPTLGALSSLAHSLKLAPNSVLVHQLTDHWLWYAPDQVGNASGWCSTEEIQDLPQLLSQLQPRYFPDVKTTYISAHDISANEHCIFSAEVKPLLPLRALQQMQPPLPAYCGAFTLATGLALRPKDD